MSLTLSTYWSPRALRIKLIFTFSTPSRVHVAIYQGTPWRQGGELIHGRGLALPLLYITVEPNLCMSSFSALRWNVKVETAMVVEVEASLDTEAEGDVC